MDMMLVLKKMNLTAIWTHASAQILINMSLVIIPSIGKVFLKGIYSGDIAVSARTVDTLMITSDDSNLGPGNHGPKPNGAFIDSTIQLWNQNPVNGKYVIAYELDPGLDEKLKTKLPKVCYILYVTVRMFPIPL